MCRFFFVQVNACVGTTAFFTSKCPTFLSELLSNLLITHNGTYRVRCIIGKHWSKAKYNIPDIPCWHPFVFMVLCKVRAYIGAYLKTAGLSVELNMRWFHWVFIWQEDHTMVQSPFKLTMRWSQKTKVHICHVFRVYKSFKPWVWFFLILS